MTNYKKPTTKKREAKPFVQLVDYQADAVDLLLFTKNTRLSPGETPAAALAAIAALPYDQKMEELQYMFDTIKTSLEFVDYTFFIGNVSRAFTHQLVRTRTASYQQEAMRVVDASDRTCLYTTDHEIYELSIEHAMMSYAHLLKEGVHQQDARGILPTAVHTNIMMKANLRTLSTMAEMRLCKRAEGEYQTVFKLLIQEVLNVHPWASPLLRVACAKNGICIFPRYDKCPVQQHTIKPTSAQLEAIFQAWKDSNHVAKPTAIAGRTM